MVFLSRECVPFVISLWCLCDIYTIVLQRSIFVRDITVISIRLCFRDWFSFVISLWYLSAIFVISPCCLYGIHVICVFCECFRANLLPSELVFWKDKGARHARPRFSGVTAHGALAEARKQLSGVTAPIPNSDTSSNLYIEGHLWSQHVGYSGVPAAASHSHVSRSAGIHKKMIGIPEKSREYN